MIADSDEFPEKNRARTPFFSRAFKTQWVEEKAYGSRDST